MQSSMVIFCVVNNQDDAAARPTTGLANLAKKGPSALAVELLRFPQGHEFSVPQAHGAEVANGLARRMVQQHRVLLLRRHPHSTAGSVLLEMHFIHGPQINAFVSRPLAEFFYKPPGLAHPRERSADAACAGGTPIAGTIAGTVALSISRQNVCPGKPKGLCHPTGRRTIPPPRGFAARRSGPFPVVLQLDGVGVRFFLRPPNRQSHERRTDEPSTQACAERRQAGGPLPGRSSPQPPKARRAAGDRSAPVPSGGFHLAGPKSFLLYQVWSAASFPPT